MNKLLYIKTFFTHFSDLMRILDNFIKIKIKENSSLSPESLKEAREFYERMENSHPPEEAKEEIRQKVYFSSPFNDKKVNEAMRANGIKIKESI